ncbi:hypothetical protein BG011_000309 [Mortierella polycephala]|uniref:Uncharacterized protein n=1 Tax=Mortierella polycephala TaxID=41804 RepID=A0A9P6QB71_9FUNG|nr:hypothetical protein BG011_000309 [Mortierella polycephala]
MSAEGKSPTRITVGDTPKSNLKSLGVDFVGDGFSLSWLLGLAPNLKEYNCDVTGELNTEQDADLDVEMATEQDN